MTTIIIHDTITNSLTLAVTHGSHHALAIHDDNGHIFGIQTSQARIYEATNTKRYQVIVDLQKDIVTAVEESLIDPSCQHEIGLPQSFEDALKTAVELRYKVRHVMGQANCTDMIYIAESLQSETVEFLISQLNDKSYDYDRAVRY